MKNKKHLPFFGVGPIYVIAIICCTLVGIIINEKGMLPSGRIDILKTPFLILGIALIILGVYLSIGAIVQSKVHKNIKNNKLVTTGVYSIVRNPIYSSYMLMCTGVLLIVNNMWLLLLPVLYWVFMTVLMKNTEEKWLYNLYGEQYLEYCKNVNRCIPLAKR